MNKEQFYIYLSDFEQLSNNSLNELMQLLEEYPYFQSARTLYLKNLYDLNDIKFENALKNYSVFIPDRKILSKIIKENYIFSTEKDKIQIEKTVNIDYIQLINNSNKNEEFTLINDIEISEKHIEKTDEKENIIIPEIQKTPSEDESIKYNNRNISDYILSKIDTAKNENFNNLNHENINNIDFSTDKESQSIENKGEILADIILRKIQEAKNQKNENEKVFSDNKTDNNINVKITENIEKLLEDQQLIEEKETEIIIKEETLADTILRKISEAKSQGIENENIFIEVKNFIDNKINNNFHIETDENIKSPIRNQQLTEIEIDKEDRKNKERIIDDFIIAEPKIIPNKNFTPQNKIQDFDNQFNTENLFSEKLAEIYVKQKHFDKALDIYEKLNLKFPEKSVYFAVKIKKIEEFKNNNK
ncbi:MAG: hypothetical protein LBV69_09340 [Bacteroidales bacterium]|jgi:hypothetical protein|nr:hypothetical protein [Bacteroidales bacterium]